jgi:hypothetical protein
MISSFLSHEPAFHGFFDALHRDGSAILEIELLFWIPLFLKASEANQNNIVLGKTIHP